MSLGGVQHRVHGRELVESLGQSSPSISKGQLEVLGG